MKKRYLVGAGVIFATGLLLGDKFADPVDHWHTITKHETKTETVQSPAPPPIKFIPKSCIQASELGQRIGRLANDLDASSTELLDQIAAVRGTDDSSKLSEVEEETRALQSKTVDIVFKLSQLEPEQAAKTETCKEQE